GPPLGRLDRGPAVGGQPARHGRRQRRERRMIGVQGVLSRIAELQSQLGIAPATNGAAFAAALSGATGATGAPSTPALSGAGSATGQAVVDAAKKYLGTPYVFGGTDPNTGLDCSGLVQRAYRDLGIDLPRTSREQAKAGIAVDGLANARPG